MMKISIIVPVYNVEAYLEECILSVLRQTYPDFEIILIDDGSTDSSGRICDRFAQQNPEKIRVLHNTNQGALISRLAGICESSGDIVMFLDSDDTLRVDALETVADCFQNVDCDMVFFDSEDDPNFATLKISHVMDDKTLYDTELKKILYEKLVTYQIPNTVWSKAIRKECAILEEDFCRFGCVRHGEDLLLSAHFLTNCNSVLYIKEGLYHYRARPGSAVHSFDIQRKESIKIVHTELEKCIDQWDMPELKPIHNLRKVSGWIETLVMLLKNKNTMSGTEFRNELTSMAEDPYFLSAYSNMDRSKLSRRNQCLASCLAKKHYSLLHAYSTVVQAVHKLKSGR